MKAKTAMKVGLAAVGVAAITMYLKNNPDMMEKMKNTATRMMKKNMTMDLDALYDEM